MTLVVEISFIFGALVLSFINRNAKRVINLRIELLNMCRMLTTNFPTWYVPHRSWFLLLLLLFINIHAFIYSLM